MKKVRNAIGFQKFDMNEKLVTRVMDEGNEKTLINEAIDIFTVVDLITREAKEHTFMSRRRIEVLSGHLMVMVVDEFLG